ncbi:MAG TPA: CheR family methyltransferase, partial [Gammaproteobacteria bacterium]|nr:CheR family methyltransferase [Gammaproteobacteria bacterium]
MRILAIDAWPAYLERLRADPGEVDMLTQEILLNATEFFGHRKAFERLENEALSRLFALKPGENDTLRAWVVGCATGEEAYSLAITLLEQRAKRDVRPRIQVFASDLSEDGLQRGRLGLYPTEIETVMSPARLAKFFVREDDHGYRVTQLLRNIVVFAWHNVVKDFPFSQLDIVVCRRGLLDGFKPEIRQAVLRNFHYALKPHGLLIIDSSSRPDEETPQLFG